MARLLVIIIILFCAPLVTASSGYSNTNVALSTKEVRLTTENIAYALEHIYLYPERAKYISQTLVSDAYQKTLHGAYDLAQFRQNIRTSLVKATLDTGFDLIAETSKADLIRESASVDERLNGDVIFEISSNNIGYIRVNGNLHSKALSTSIIEAFNNLPDVDALVIDLRDAGEIELPLIQRAISYFVPAGTKIGKIEKNNQSSYIVADEISGFDKFKHDFPLYIINSSFVSGEWEFFSFALQQLGKATIIGETTMGVGVLSQSVKVANNIILQLPYAKVTSPTEDSSWDESGVEPDLFMPNGDPLTTAFDLALDKISQ